MQNGWMTYPYAYLHDIGSTECITEYISVHPLWIMRKVRCLVLSSSLLRLLKLSLIQFGDRVNSTSTCKDKGGKFGNIRVEKSIVQIYSYNQ